MYYLSHFEDYIKRLYTSMGVYFPQQLQFLEISKKLGIQVYYWARSSQALFHREYAYIFLNEEQSEQRIWQDFCHELGHVLLHVGNQHLMTKSFITYQEQKANNFMYHACVPSFMLHNLKISDYTYETIEMVKELFCVEESFAKKRLQQYLNNLFAQKMIFRETS